jgi:hypothetical protein
MSAPDPKAATRAASHQRWLAALLNPAGLISESLNGLGAVPALGISGLAFSTISLQAALDLSRTAAWATDALLLLVVRGALLGTLGVALLALLAWLLSRPFGVSQGLGWTVRAFGGAYGSALIYGLFGLGLNLALGWNTSVSCGVTGLLWALGPVFLTLRELSGGRPGLAAGLATICGALMLFGWVQLGVGS